MKDRGTAYLLWALSFLGFAGVHRIYLGRYISGFMYFMTWGFFGVGTIIDAFAIARMVDEENMLEASRHQAMLPGGGMAVLPSGEAAVSPEKQILRLASSQGGSVTPQQVALNTTLSLAEAREALGLLSAEGHCDLHIGDDGSEQYHFIGLTPSSRTI